MSEQTWEPGDRVPGSQTIHVSRQGLFQIEDAFTEHECGPACEPPDSARWPIPREKHDLDRFPDPFTERETYAR